jgi:hypothetical protein
MKEKQPKPTMKFAYADPPYLGCGKLYEKHHSEALVWDDPQTHQDLINRLSDEFPDGWAYSLSSTTLQTIMPFCPSDVRVMAWVKPFCSFKPNVNPAYAWEPVIVRGGRKRSREMETVPDFVSCNITLKKGLTGAKPLGFWLWLFSILNAEPSDEFCDLFPGSNGGSKAWSTFCSQQSIFQRRKDNSIKSEALDLFESTKER